MQKTIKDFSVTELKAMAFDQIVSIEQSQNNLKVINQELVSRQEKPVETTEESTEPSVESPYVAPEEK